MKYATIFALGPTSETVSITFVKAALCPAFSVANHRPYALFATGLRSSPFCMPRHVFQPARQASPPHSIVHASLK